MRRTAVLACILIFIAMIPLVAQASETYVPPPDQNKAPRVTVKSLYAAKCSKCHPLSRADQAKKTPTGWTDTVSRMRSKDPKWISEEEYQKICSFLSGRDLFDIKCAKCHAASKSDVQKTLVQWKNTVDRMQKKEADFITEDDKKYILFYLTDVQLLELE